MYYLKRKKMNQVIEAIIKFLAPYLDKLKAKNPAVFLLVQTVLAALQFGIIYAVENGVLAEDGWVTIVLQVLGYAAMALVGSRTFKYVEKKK